MPKNIFIKIEIQGEHKTAKINIMVGGIGGEFIEKVKKVIMYPIIFSPENELSFTPDGIKLPGRTELSIPVGWLGIIVIMITSYSISLRILGVRRKQLIMDKYKSLISITISVFLVFLIFIFDFNIILLAVICTRKL